MLGVEAAVLAADAQVRAVLRRAVAALCDLEPDAVELVSFDEQRLRRRSAETGALRVVATATTTSTSTTSTSSSTSTSTSTSTNTTTTTTTVASTAIASATTVTSAAIVSATTGADTQGCVTKRFSEFRCSLTKFI